MFRIIINTIIIIININIIKVGKGRESVYVPVGDSLLKITESLKAAKPAKNNEAFHFGK